MNQTSSNPLVAFSEALADAVEKAAQSTVLVDARRRHPASGVSIASDLVLTAEHVIEREDEIRLVFPNGQEGTASLTGVDGSSDLAVLRVKSGGLTVAEKAAEEARPGQLALALGRPTTEGIQASLGVISAVGGPVRTGRGSMLEKYYRTDTIPYPGFSGGPLVDAAGRVLGINTSGLWQGGSLTIPASLAWSIGEMLAQHGSIKRGYLGVRSQGVALPAAQQKALGREQSGGVLLVGVEDDSPAERGGLLVGDILVALSGNPVSEPDDLSARLMGSMVGQPVVLQILRGGQPQNLTVIIGERK
jgi:S1-C subfamily serine protease